MSQGTGVAGLAVTALVAAVVAVAAAALFPPSPAAPPPGSRSSAEADLREEVERLRAEVAELRASRGAAGDPGSAAAGPVAGPAAVAGTGPAPAGSPGEGASALPASRDDLVALIDGRIAEKFAAAGPAVASRPAKKRVTIEEAGAEIGLSAFEIDAAKRVHRAAEDEMLVAVMGTADLEAIQQEVRAAKDDPDRKAALVNKAIGNVFRNLGHVMTIEDRRDRELRKVLPEDKVKRLKEYDLKPTFDDAELGEVLEGVFNN
jgi:hypothetical protein